MSSDTPTPDPANPPAVPPAAHAIPPAGPAYVPDENEMKRALAAFRKRLRALQLETDSKLGRSALTGKKETITAIQPPLGFGKDVWQHLASIGWLKNEGRGFYQLLKKD